MEDNIDPFVITKDYAFPAQEWTTFVQKDRQKYYSVNATTNTEGAKCFLKDVYKGKIYIQYGLKEDADNSITNNPLIRFYTTLMQSPMAKKIEELRLLIEAKFDIQAVPCFINGNYKPVTKTHFDNYHNVILLLEGKKTFYLAKQGSIVKTKNKNANETDSNPHEGESVFVKTVLTPGDVLYIPLGWWHYVESAPNSIMLNFWFVPRPCDASGARSTPCKVQNLRGKGAASRMQHANR